jgi:dethiobiotin synthetase
LRDAADRRHRHRYQHRQGRVLGRAHGALDDYYWVQSGLEDETDAQAVRRLSGLAAKRILPERYRLTTPASPHLAAAIDGVAIDPERLQSP